MLKSFCRHVSWPLQMPIFLQHASFSYKKTNYLDFSINLLIIIIVDGMPIYEGFYKIPWRYILHLVTFVTDYILANYVNCSYFNNSMTKTLISG